MRAFEFRFLVIFLGLVNFAFICAPVESRGVGSVHIMGVWGGDELKAFRSVVAEWEKRTGGRVEFEGTRDLAAILRARVMGGNPPDLAILPNPALMKEFARSGKLKSIDTILERSGIRNNFSSAWVQMGTVGGTLLGLFVKGTVKSTVWYNPKEFAANRWGVPKTWEGLLSLSDRIVSEGKTPWSIAVESGGASGWPATDWIQEIFLRESGPARYDQWVNHEIPWTHDQVRSAFRKFGQIALTRGYVTGGVEAILATHFIEGAYLLFQRPPRANMVLLGGFTQGFIAKQFPRLKPGEGYDFFPFPVIDPRYEGAVTGAADVVVMFRDTVASRSLLKYLATGKAWTPWARCGGYASPNRSLGLEAYPDPLARKVATLLTTSLVFRFDADDLMPAEVQKSFWKETMGYLRRPEELDAILREMEEVAKGAY